LNVLDLEIPDELNSLCAAFFSPHITSDDIPISDFTQKKRGILILPVPLSEVFAKPVQPNRAANPHAVSIIRAYKLFYIPI
jgi:hypothetical protein